MNLLVDRRRPLQAPDRGRHEPERKRVCRNLDAVPQEISICHPPSKYTVDYWSKEQAWKERDSTELFRIMKEKPNSMIFPDNETRTAAQPCSRCIAGEPGHFGHMMGL